MMILGISVLVAVGVASLIGRAFLRWYLGLDRIERLMLDVAVSLRTLPSVREYDEMFDRPAPKAA